eukprot:4886135-Amphidinium_carterae.1
MDRRLPLLELRRRPAHALMRMDGSDWSFGRSCPGMTTQHEYRVTHASARELDVGTSARDIAIAACTSTHSSMRVNRVSNTNMLRPLRSAWQTEQRGSVDGCMKTLLLSR